jgi:hypothetical protein
MLDLNCLAKEWQDNSLRGSFAMSQLYLQRFEYRAATKSEFDQAWGIALQTFARTGNYGGAEAGVRHLKSYGTAWAGMCCLKWTMLMRSLATSYTTQ